MVVGHRPCEISPVPPTTFPASRPPYAGEFFTAALPGSSPLPWPSLSLKSSALPCSPTGANISTLLCEALLRHSLYVTGCWFAPPSRRDTTLQHSQSPNCTGCLLCGLLVVTTTGLAPVSPWQTQDTPCGVRPFSLFDLWPTIIAHCETIFWIMCHRRTTSYTKIHFIP